MTGTMTAHRMGLVLFRSCLYSWLWLYNAMSSMQRTVVEWQCRKLVGAPLGITRIQHVTETETKTIYDLESVFGFLRYVLGFTKTWATTSDDQPSLWAVRYIRQNAIHTVLLRCPLDAVHHALDGAKAFAPPRTRIILAYLNGINISAAVLPMLASFNSVNSLRVKDLAAWLMASGALTKRQVHQLVLREGVLELSFVDSDLDDIEFTGSKREVILQ